MINNILVVEEKIQDNILSFLKKLGFLTVTEIFTNICFGHIVQQTERRKTTDAMDSSLRVSKTSVCIFLRVAQGHGVPASSGYWCVGHDLQRRGND